jgi:hypothetical protein
MTTHVYFERPTHKWRAKSHISVSTWNYIRVSNILCVLVIFTFKYDPKYDPQFPKRCYLRHIIKGLSLKIALLNIKTRRKCKGDRKIKTKVWLKMWYITSWINWCVKVRLKMEVFMDDDKIKNLSWPRQMEPNGFMKFFQYTCYEKTT